MRIALRSTVLLPSLLVATIARGTTFVVPPGPGTPVQDAIDAASPGDTIRLSIGVYPERLVIDKAIKLRGVRSASVDPNDTTTIQDAGGCGNGFGSTITIFADRVQLRGIQVSAGSQGGIEAIGDHINLIDVFVGRACEVLSAPLINVRFSTHVKLSAVWASGSPLRNVPAGIRISDIPPQGRVRVTRSVAGGNAIGILLENDGSRAVRISGSHVNFNDRGIVIRTTSGTVVHDDELIGNTTSGVELEATASENTVAGNQISGSVNDVVDAGTSNCWRNNKYTTGSVAPCP